jgi:hypothetical protein
VPYAHIVLRIVPVTPSTKVSGGQCSSLAGVLFVCLWYYVCLFSQLWHSPYWVITWMYIYKWSPKPKKELQADEDGRVFDVQYVAQVTQYSNL